MALDPNATWSAGLKDAKVRDSSGNLYDLNAVISIEGDPKQDEIEVKGDDEVKATFVTSLSEDLSIVSNGISFDVLQAITGNSYSSSPTGVEIGLGTDSQENPPFVELIGRSQAKNADGTKVDLIKTWYKVQIYSVKITQAGEKEVACEMKARAYQADEDITGVALPEKRVAKLAIGPQA